MLIRSRTLAASLLVGLAILGGCAVVYLLSAQTPRISAPTEGPPATFPTAAGPGPTAQPFDPAHDRPPLPEPQRLRVEFPVRVRTGDPGRVQLTLEVDDRGHITPTTEIGGNVVTAETVEIPNAYESYQVIAESRFDLAGMEVRPGELVSEALSPGNPVTFRWNIRPDEPGVYRGTIWLYLRFVDRKSGEESRRTVSAQIVEIEAVSLLGLSGDLARTTGVVGLIVGTIVGLPFFEDLVRLFLKRRNREKW